MKPILSAVVERLSDLGALLVMGAALLILFDVLARLWFNMPFQGTADLIGIALVLVTFLQAPKAIWGDRLLRVTALLEVLPLRLRSVLSLIACLVGAAVFFGLSLTSLGLIADSRRMQEFFGTDAFRIPAWPIYASIAGLWLIAAFSFLARSRRRGLSEGGKP